MPAIVPLQMLAAGAEGYVAELGGCEQTVHRLEEIGFRRGARIRMVRSGSPCIVVVEGHKISFRCAETDVLVALDDAARQASPAPHQPASVELP